MPITRLLPDLLVTVFEEVDRSALPEFVIFDSGGFIFALQGRYDEADSYLGKLISIYRRVARPSDLLLQLDLPLLPSMPKHFRMELQRRNVRYYTVMKRIFGSQLVPVLHGWSPDEWEVQLQHIKTDVIAVGSFFGMLSPPMFKKGTSVRLNPKEVAVRLVKISNYVITRTNARLALLGAGSPKAMFIAAALGFEIADSSTWRVAAIFGEVYHPVTLERIYARKIQSHINVFKVAYREVDHLYGAPWSFSTWLELVKERSRGGYVARAWFNAMITKLTQYRVEAMSEERLIKEMLRIYRNSSRWSKIAEIVAGNSYFVGFRRVLPRAE